MSGTLSCHAANVEKVSEASENGVVLSVTF